MAKRKEEMLTAKEFAKRAGVTYPTVLSWLKSQRIPGAILKEDTRFGKYWDIPASSLLKVKKQKTGPKPKKADAAE
jgi:predicted transcriptional regulator